MKLKPQFRFFQTKEIKLDKETRTIEFSFSSEAPVRRWFGDEVLSHEHKAADFSRLNDGANVLFNHNPDIIVGVVEKAEIRSDKRGYAKIRFSKNTKAQEIMQDVEDGIMRNVSFGYEIRELDLVSENGDQKTFVSNSWAPFEISLVSIPADAQVGIGRSEDYEEKEVLVHDLVEKAEKKVLEETKTDKKHKELENFKGEKEKVMENEKPVDIQLLKNEAIAVERTRIATINAIGEKLGQGELARQLIEGGKTIDEARAAFLDKVNVNTKPISENDSKIGMSEKEVKKYSFIKALNALANPNDAKIQNEASFEREVSIAGQKHMGKNSQGFYVPHDVMAAKRDLVVGTNSAGGYTVATDLLSMIELLRNKMALNQAGITVLSGLKGNVAIPKHTGASTFYHVAENAAPTESALTFGQIAMSPKTGGTYIDIGRRLLIQSSEDVEALVRSDLAMVMALGFDYYALYGSGSSNQPTGAKVAIASSSTEVNFGANTPTFAEVVSLETAINAGNADVGSMKYICNASMAGALKTAEKASGYPQYILDGGQANGYPVIVSNQSASNDLWFGAWSQLVLGFWGGLDLMADPYTFSNTGAIRVRILQEYDVALRHAESIARGNNAP